MADQNFLLPHFERLCAINAYHIVVERFSKVSDEDLRWGRKDEFRLNLVDIIARTKSLMSRVSLFF